MWRSNAVMYVTLHYNKGLFSTLYFFKPANRKLILEFTSYKGKGNTEVM
jgi:hypothetical protein